MKAIKNVIQVLVIPITSLLLITSCERDDDVITNLSKSLFGAWESHSFKANEPLFDMNKDGINSIELLDELPCRYSKLVLKSDFTFYQENNTWMYIENLDSYECSNEVISASGTWRMNSNFSALILEIDGNISLVEIEFDGEVLEFNSSEIFSNRNALGEYQNIYGKASYKRN